MRKGELIQLKLPDILAALEMELRYREESIVPEIHPDLSPRGG